jgi:hypothetical protein
MKSKELVSWTIIFAVADFLGAVSFYAGYQNQWLCPACAVVDGDYIHRVSRVILSTLIFGLLNAILFVIAGWTLWVLTRAVKKIAG